MTKKSIFNYQFKSVIMLLEKVVEELGIIKFRKLTTILEFWGAPIWLSQ